MALCAAVTGILQLLQAQAAVPSETLVPVAGGIGQAHGPVAQKPLGAIPQRVECIRNPGRPLAHTGASTGMARKETGSVTVPGTIVLKCVNAISSAGARQSAPL